jgi:hypothetical protein
MPAFIKADVGGDESKDWTWRSESVLTAQAWGRESEELRSNSNRRSFLEPSPITSLLFSGAAGGTES